MTEKQCAWVENQDANWETGCGETFVFNDCMLPSEHSFKFCCFCGGELSEKCLRKIGMTEYCFMCKKFTVRCGVFCSKCGFKSLSEV